jgi:hypothetical protein
MEVPPAREEAAVHQERFTVARSWVRAGAGSREAKPGEDLAPAASERPEEPGTFLGKGVPEVFRGVAAPVDEEGEEASCRAGLKACPGQPAAARAGGRERRGGAGGPGPRCR